MSDHDFADRVALITGGGQGLGQAFAEALAQAGATVVSGRYVDVDDDLTALLQQANGLKRDDLYTLRLRTSYGEKFMAALYERVLGQSAQGLFDMPRV